MAGLATGMERDPRAGQADLRQGDARARSAVRRRGGFSVQPTTALLIRRAQHLGEINHNLDPDALAAALEALYLQQLVRWCEAETPYALNDWLTGIVELLMMGIAARIGDRIDPIPSTPIGGSDRLDQGFGLGFVSGRGNPVRLDRPVHAHRICPAPRLCGAGAPAPDGIQLWQRHQDGQVYVNATALADVARAGSTAPPGWIDPRRDARWGARPPSDRRHDPQGPSTHRRLPRRHPRPACAHSQMVGLGSRVTLDASRPAPGDGGVGTKGTRCPANLLHPARRAVRSRGAGDDTSGGVAA